MFVGGWGVGGGAGEVWGAGRWSGWVANHGEVSRSYSASYVSLLYGKQMPTQYEASLKGTSRG